MYLSYEILRNLAPDDMTPAHQRAADEQLGSLVAVLTRRGRVGRSEAAHNGSGTATPRHFHWHVFER